MRRLSLAVALSLVAVALLSRPALARRAGQTTTGQVRLLNARGSAVDRITDGDRIRLHVDLPQPAESSTVVQFELDGEPPAIATCQVNRGEGSCETETLSTLGWFWSVGGGASPRRLISAGLVAGTPIGSVSFDVAPRPVVMVHGFASTWQAWTAYLGPSGYLAAQGLAGFAVGDGQVPGVMKTGDFVDPAGRTNTIAENAAVLSGYIDEVKKATGAEQVDLIAHSMGGLIARYYIDRVMADRDVAQLIMLGSPMAGTDCADLPASLGLYLPATLEIRPGYVTDVFNANITRRHGVPFHALAGVPILEGFQAPCTDVPSDLAVALDSVIAIPLSSSQLPVLHMNLNSSEEVFRDFVLPLLQTPPAGFPDVADPPASGPAEAPLQFSRVFTGHLAPGQDQELTIPIDAGMVLASFALYDSSRSLDVAVRGASGNVIELSPEANGLVVVRDPTMLFYLGYGFQNPKPGEWRVTLSTTDATPAEGADFALAAHFLGGAQAEAHLSAILPRVGEEVTLTASLGPPSLGISLDDAAATIRGSSGDVENVELGLSGSQARAIWAPRAAGLYGIDVSLNGAASDGTPIERTVFLALEAQPTTLAPTWTAFWPAAIAVLIIYGMIVVWIRSRRKRLRSQGDSTS